MRIVRVNAALSTLFIYDNFDDVRLARLVIDHGSECELIFQSPQLVLGWFETTFGSKSDLPGQEPRGFAKVVKVHLGVVQVLLFSGGKRFVHGILSDGNGTFERDRFLCDGGGGGGRGQAAVATF